MKSTIIKVTLIFLFVLKLVNVSGQKSCMDTYIIKEKDSLFKFQIVAMTDSFIIRTIDLKKDTIIGSCSIRDITDHFELQCSVMKLIPNSKEPEVIANQLESKFKSNSTKKDNQQKAFNERSLAIIDKIKNDKGEVLESISLKKKPVGVIKIHTSNYDDRVDARALKHFTDSLNEKRKPGMLLYTDTISIEKERRRLKNRRSIYSSEYELLAKRGDTTTVNIDSVQIAFENGVIKDIKVRAIDKGEIYYFTNPRYIPIRNAQDIDRISSKNNNLLTFRCDRDHIMVLDFANIVDFNRTVQFGSGTYIPKDTTLTIKEGISKYIKKPSMIECFDLRLYTDVLGYSGTMPNGIIQAEAQINFGLNEGKTKYRLYNIYKNEQRSNYRHQWVWFNRYSPYIRIMKFEKSNVSLNSVFDSVKTDLLEIYKYSKLEIGNELNILTYRTDSKLITLNAAGGLFRTTIGNDSVESNNKTYSTLYFNPNLEFKIFESNKIDYYFRAGGYLAWLASPFESLNYKNVVEKSMSYFAHKVNWFFQLQQSINLHPGGDKQQSFFIRTSEYLSSKNSHFTFQLGYSTSIDGIINIKNK
ncbi:MAG: hypothetical protein ACOYOV_15205 [Bacteroidales bacterium]